MSNKGLCYCSQKETRQIPTFPPMLLHYFRLATTTTVKQRRKLLAKLRDVGKHRDRIASELCVATDKIGARRRRLEATIVAWDEWCRANDKERSRCAPHPESYNTWVCGTPPQRRCQALFLHIRSIDIIVVIASRHERSLSNWPIYSAWVETDGASL